MLHSQLSSLAVGSYSASGNSITGSGNAVCILFPTFGFMNKAWCDEYEVLMKGKFEMSDMASTPDIMFVVSACSKHQVTPITSHLNAVKKIFKYLKGQPNLGLWYPRDSPFQLEAYSDSDYAGSHGDRKSTTGGCQFLGSRLISWQCKKQTIVATFSTEAKYVAAASCCGQVLLLVVLVRANDLVPAGGCTLPAGSYSFILLDWFLLVVTSDPSPRPTFDFTAKLFSNMKLNWDGPHMPLLASMLVVPAGGDDADAIAAGAAAAHDVSPPHIVPPTHSTPGPSSALQVTPMREPAPVKDLTPVRDPTPMREPTPSPVREPTPDSPRPPSHPPKTEKVGLTTSTSPPSPTRHTSVHEDISEDGGDFVSSPHTSTTRRRLRKLFTFFASAHVSENISAGASV
nr:uncharacterized mitochondrial protein AtMg00810-like [Tanacetum cinerariifolium]